MANNNERCDNCRFWEKEIHEYINSFNSANGSSASGAVGKCRKNPPVVITSSHSGNDYHTRFPIIDGNGWCGQFAPLLSDTDMAKLRDWAEHGA